MKHTLNDGNGCEACTRPIAETGEHPQVCPDCGEPWQALFHDVPCGRKPEPPTTDGPRR